MFFSCLVLIECPAYSPILEMNIENPLCTRLPHLISVTISTKDFVDECGQISTVMLQNVVENLIKGVKAVIVVKGRFNNKILYLTRIYGDI